MLYKLCKPVAKFILRQFFRSVVIKGEAVENAPLLVVCNHPNYMLDSLLVAAAFRRDLWFLARSTLFKSGLRSRLLNSFHIVPVYRRSDAPGETEKNEETFRRAVEILSRGKGIVIFPEGISAGEMRILPLKTGAARIAFQAESGANFALGLKVQPVGITYSDLTLFRSSVTIVFGEAFEVAALRGEYEKNAIEAVRAFTDRIEGWLKEVSVEVKERAFEALVVKVAKVYESAGTPRDDFERLKLIARNVDALAPAQPERRRELESKIESYLELCAEMHVYNMGSLESRLDRLYAVLLAPIVVLGILTHYIPYEIVGRLARQAAKQPVVLASYKFSYGAMIFSAWYLILFLAALFLSGSALSALLIILAVLVSAIYVNNYLHHLRLFVLSLLWPGTASPLEILKLMRDDLIAELNALRVE